MPGYGELPSTTEVTGGSKIQTSHLFGDGRLIHLATAGANLTYYPLVCQFGFVASDITVTVASEPFAVIPLYFSAFCG